MSTFFLLLILIINDSTSLRTNEFCLNSDCNQKECKALTICNGRLVLNILNL